jgi:hypothetical protein
MISLLLGLVLVPWTSLFTLAESPSDQAQEVAKVVRHETLLPPNGPEGRPLPLVGHWNMGSYGKGWTSTRQMQWINEGRYLLPWFGWPQPRNVGLSKDGEAQETTPYVEYLQFCKELDLPISFRGTQWEAMLVRSEYRERPVEQCPAVVTPEGKAVKKLSPFGPIEPWRDPAEYYVATEAMKKAQSIYPDPPRVLFVSNNEAPDLRWHQVEELSKRYLDRYGKGKPDDFQRQKVSEGWMERYPVMFQAMREALVEEGWRDQIRFIGYGAFGPSHLGRWDGWKEYSLATDQWTSPHWHIWDGGSPSYYTHNWSDIRDHRVWSTQVEAMNWLFQLEEAWRANPDFWWELSIWDGNQGAWKPGMPCDEEMLKKSKACQYMNDGQSYTPERFAGWLQYGMWLLRPRVIREFRGSTVAIEPWMPYFREILDAVGRVHQSPVLSRFWRHGRLVPNTEHRHPFQANLPDRLRSIHRWYLLDTNLDPPRPWNQKTNLPVFALALEMGEGEERSWLLYAHSPLEDREEVIIELPGFGPVTTEVPRAGIFLQVDQAGRKWSPVEIARKRSIP